MNNVPPPLSDSFCRQECISVVDDGHETMAATNLVQCCKTEDLYAQLVSSQYCELDLIIDALSGEWQEVLRQATKCNQLQRFSVAI